MTNKGDGKTDDSGKLWWHPISIQLNTDTTTKHLLLEMKQKKCVKIYQQKGDVIVSFCYLTKEHNLCHKQIKNFFKQQPDVPIFF